MNSATISNLYTDCKIIEIWDNITNEKIGLRFEQKHPISISDGYHTMSELYQHRYALFSALVKVYDNYKTPLGCHITCWKSKLHQDGTMFENAFIVGMTVHKIDTSVENITYHYPIEWWDKINVMQYERAPEWDGHTSEDVYGEVRPTLMNEIKCQQCGNSDESMLEITDTSVFIRIICNVCSKQTLINKLEK